MSVVPSRLSTTTAAGAAWSSAVGGEMRAGRELARKLSSRENIVQKCTASRKTDDGCS